MKTIYLFLLLGLVLVGCLSNNNDNNENNVNQTDSSDVTDSISTEYDTINNQYCIYNQGMPTGTLECAEKTYKTTQIGTRVWMAENLAWLPTVHSVYAMTSSNEPRFYVNDYYGIDVNEAIQEEMYSVYGVYYNYPASIGACPIGWHVPSDLEWMDMEISLGMNPSVLENTGERGYRESFLIKAAGKWNWDETDEESMDSTHFSALPGGSCLTHCTYWGTSGFWWTSTTKDNAVYYRSLKNSLWGIRRDVMAPDIGVNIRCIMDNSIM